MATNTGQTVQTLMSNATQSNTQLAAQNVNGINATAQASAAAKAASQVGSALKNAYQDRDSGLF